MPRRLAEALLRAAGVAEAQVSATLAALPAPDATNWTPDPSYVRELIEAAGLSQRAAARLIGVRARMMRDYCSGAREIPYPAQYALEMLAELNIPENPRKRESEGTHD